MKAVVIINEQHTLLAEQEKILREKFEEIEFVMVPASGWTLDEMRALARTDKFQERHYKDTFIVFISPIPGLIKALFNLHNVLMFHNDNREKKELPNGKIIMTVAKEGWQLI
jgi:hypothetical protein